MNTEQKSILAEKRKKYLTICMASSLILSLLIILPIEIDRSTKYNRAVEEMNKGNYESAIFIFDEIIGYRDSWSLQYDLKKKQEELKAEEEKSQIELAKDQKEEKYEEGIELMRQQKYKEAKEIFADLDYQNSHKLSLSCEQASRGNYSDVVQFLELTEFTVPFGVASVSFDDCSSLTSITIPDSVTSIRYGAFDGCSSLTSITIPNSVTSIGDSAFSGCSSLEKITLPFLDGRFVSLFKKDSFGSGAVPDSLKMVVITGGESIGNYAFSRCSGLTSITIPNSVTSIGDGAFDGCSGLTSITIPDSVTSIGDSAFYECSGLTSITIPNTVTSIGDSAFSGCSSLTSITIPDSVTSIGYLAFSRCSGLTNITIPNSVTSIGDYAFSRCSSLTSITIPDSVTSIGDSAFYGCSSLTSVCYSGSSSLWDRIYIWGGNENLTSANRYYR